MKECTLHNLLTSCQYPQVFWIYQMNDYDENILLTKGTKQEMLEDDENSFDLIDHINDVVEYWTIREDGAMFVRIRMDDRAKELFSEDYVKKWDRFNPLKRPYLYTAELDDFTNCIYGSSKYLHPYGDPLDCHHFDNDDRKTENSSEIPNNCEDLQDWKDRMWAEAIVTEPTISKMEQVDEPKTQMKTQNSNLTFEKRTMRDCYNCKRYETEGECIECNYEPKTEPTISKMEQVDKLQYNAEDQFCIEHNCPHFYQFGGCMNQGDCPYDEDEPQTCSVSGRPYSECADCEHFRCTADEPQTEICLYCEYYEPKGYCKLKKCSVSPNHKCDEYLVIEPYEVKIISKSHERIDVAKAIIEDEQTERSE